MPTVHLKNGDSVQVDIDYLEDYLHENKDKIEPIQVKRRGQLRDRVALENLCVTFSNK
ncbi:MAG: hypothetical protein PUP92_00550 [Rhizonema sp. PD38]|nr:hypothetical protein [Rhizonema sp. PD38]